MDLLAMDIGLMELLFRVESIKVLLPSEYKKSEVFLVAIVPVYIHYHAHWLVLALVDCVKSVSSASDNQSSFRHISSCWFDWCCTRWLGCEQTHWCSFWQSLGQWHILVSGMQHWLCSNDNSAAQIVPWAPMHRPLDARQRRNDVFPRVFKTAL